MKNIKDLFNEHLTWFEEASTPAIFISEQYSTEDCYLRINDFPEEPLWTLFYNNESLDFDETPTRWKIKYIGKL